MCIASSVEVVESIMQGTKISASRLKKSRVAYQVSRGWSIRTSKESSAQRTASTDLQLDDLCRALIKVAVATNETDTRRFASGKVVERGSP